MENQHLIYSRYSGRYRSRNAMTSTYRTPGKEGGGSYIPSGEGADERVSRRESAYSHISRRESSDIREPRKEDADGRIPREEGAGGHMPREGSGETTHVSHSTRFAPRGRGATRRMPPRTDAPNFSPRFWKRKGGFIFQKARRFDRRLPLVLTIFAIGCALFFASGAFSYAVLEPAISADQGASTPKQDWRKGQVPFLYQTDPEWAEEPYAGGTVKENGCGPTCLSMVYVDLTGKTDLDPGQMAAFSEGNGHVDSGMTSWTLMTDGAKKLGLASEELPAEKASVSSALTRGKPVICSVGPGDFTTSGHFIVLAGLDESGKAIVHDPNSNERSQQTWDIDRILAQCRNLWAFSAA